MDYSFSAVVFLFGVCAGIIGFGIFSSSKRKKYENFIYELKNKLKLYEHDRISKENLLSDITAKYDDLNEKFLCEKEDNIRLKEKVLLIDDINELRKKFESETFLRAKAEEKLKFLSGIEILAEEKNKEIIFLNEKISELKMNYSKSLTRLEEQEKLNNLRIKDFEESKKSLSLEFENLANKIFEDKSKNFSHKNRQELLEILNPVRIQLTDFRTRVDQVHSEDLENRTKLSEQILNLHKINQEMNEEAKNLTRALKGDNKVQGNWGEMILEKVLEQSGLRKNAEYFTQGAFRNSDNKLLKPDVIVKLPEGKDIIIDSKVSLIAYNRYVNSVNHDQRSGFLKEHIDSVKQHIISLGNKKYEELKDLRSLDFILMFMPIEGAFSLAFQSEESLFDVAFSKRIVVVTPTTLLATLRTIENIWRYERQNESASKIAEKAGKMYDKFRLFLEDFKKIEKNIEALQSNYTLALNKLSKGRGNLIQQAEDFVDLGVNVKKKIHSDFTENDNNSAVQTINDY